MAEKISLEVRVLSILPQEAQARFEGHLAQSELQFSQAYQKLAKNPNRHGNQYHDLVENEVIDYVYRLFFAFCDEVLTSESSTSVVRRHIEVFLAFIMDKAFHSKHPNNMSTLWQHAHSAFCDRTKKTILQSHDWISIQELLQARALTEAARDGIKTSTQSNRFESVVNSPVAARRMEKFISDRGMGLTEFAGRVDTTDRTLRNFRRTGKLRRTILDRIATEMGITREKLLKPE